MARRNRSYAFFNTRKVIDALGKASHDALSKFGAYVRRSARSSLRVGRRKRESELTEDELKAFKRAKAINKRKGRKPPKRRRISAEPGNPPKLRYSDSPLKKLIEFGFDLQTRSVVVGPLDYKGKGGAQKLEHGIGGYRRFPFMSPQLINNAHLLPGLWKNSIRK